MKKMTSPWKVTMGRGTDVLLAPTGAALAEDFGGKSANDDGLDGADCYLVNKADDEEIAVLCVLANKGSGDALLGDSFKQSPMRVGSTIKISVIVDPATNLPARRNYALYSGWLILSPHDQHLAWLILAEPVEMLPAQVPGLSASAGPKLRLVDGEFGRSARSPGN